MALLGTSDDVYPSDEIVISNSSFMDNTAPAAAIFFSHSKRLELNKVTI